MRKVALIGFFVLLISPMAALADTISFSSNTSSGSSWAMVGSPFPIFTLSSALTSAQLNSGPLNTGIAYGKIGWTTADGVPLFGSPIDLVVFNPGGIVTVTGDLGFGSGFEALFTGSFQNAWTLVTGGAPGQSTFSASFIAGNLNPALFSFLGADPLSPEVTGTLTATLNGTPSGGSGSVAGAMISLNAPTAVPEPAMLTMLGMGLLALAGLSRKKLISQRNAC